MPKNIEKETIHDLQLITDLLSELSLLNTEQEVASLICERSRQLIGADGVTFIKLENESAHYLEESSDEPIFKGEVIPLDQCVCGWSLKQNAPAFIADVIEDDRTDSSRFEHNFVTSLAMIPIRNPEPIGAIGFYYATPHSFPVKETKIMQCLASATEFALRNIYLLSRIDLIVSERTAALQSVNSELESFAYTVSHDLKNPLSIIKANCWTILELLKSEVSDKAFESVQRIDSAAARMNGQIEGMLSMYRLTKDDIKAEKVDLSSIARGIADDLLKLYSEREIEFRIEDNLNAYGDKNMFSVMIENLLSNAIKFSSNANPAVIEFLTETTGNAGPTFCVRDNGMGFDQECADELFKVFKRLPQCSGIEGHGIGLTSVQRIINKHGGRVWAEGIEGQGASFFFTLPALSMDSNLEVFIDTKESLQDRAGGSN